MQKAFHEDMERDQVLAELEESPHVMENIIAQAVITQGADANEEAPTITLDEEAAAEAIAHNEELIAKL